MALKKVTPTYDVYHRKDNISLSSKVLFCAEVALCCVRVRRLATNSGWVTRRLFYKRGYTDVVHTHRCRDGENFFKWLCI